MDDDLELVEAALAGDEEAAHMIAEMIREPRLLAVLVKRGAKLQEAEDIVSELADGCFGKEHKKGQLANLLDKYSGKAPLAAYLNRVALHRLISHKRKKRPDGISLDTGGGEGGELQVGSEVAASEDVIVDLLREAIMKAFAEVDQEKLVMFRLVQSYRLKQKRVGAMWGWHESKVARNLGSLRDELREKILENIRQRDPWLNLEWEDFLALCGESVDLFDYL